MGLIKDIKRKEFEDWLATKTTSEIVGKSGICNYCPVANFIREVYGIDASVFPTITLINSKYEENPHWVTKFVLRLDKITPNGSKIKTHECENILRFIS